MKDRLLFEETKLENGITIYSKKTDDPFVLLKIMIPCGHAHNVGEILPGSFHFLEHMSLNRSERFQEKESFEKWLGMQGGGIKAYINFYYTTYELAAPKVLFEEAIMNYCDQIFSPIFTEEDIQKESSIISEEKKIHEKYYPGEDEVSHYLSTQWTNCVAMPLLQRLGDSEIFSKITQSYLYQLRQFYLNKKMIILIAGDFEQKAINKLFSSLLVSEYVLEEKVDKSFWVQKEFHVKEFDSLNRSKYILGGIIPFNDLKINMGIDFILHLVTNIIHGAVFKWLREELGWVYNIYYNWDCQRYDMVWNLEIPLNSLEKVNAVREHIHDKILKVISDPETVKNEARRQRSLRVYWYQKLNDILDIAESCLNKDKRIITEKEYLDLLEMYEDVELLKQIYFDHMSPDKIGEVWLKAV